MTNDALLMVRFDRLLTELHRRGDDDKTVCGQDMTDGTPWIPWTEDGTAHCVECFGQAAQEEAMF